MDPLSLYINLFIKRLPALYSSSACYDSKTLTLKASITTSAADKYWDIFPNFGMILHGNRLLADDSHEISCLICYCFLKKGQNF